MSNEEKVNMFTGPAGQMKIIDGIRLPGFPDENLREAMRFEPSDDDIVIITYPRTGTTWTQQILGYILNYGHYEGSYAEMILNAPYIDMTGTKPLDGVTGPRMIKTHLPFRKSLWNPRSKYIFVVRNPLDTCVSQYYYYEEKCSIDEYALAFIKGDVHYNSYKDYMIGWWHFIKEKNVLLVVYEEMKADLAGHIRKIGQFLGGTAANVVSDDKIVEEIRSKTDIKTMRDKINTTYSVIPEGEAGQQFRERFQEPLKFHRFFTGDSQVGHQMVRKGEVAQWKTQFTAETQEAFKDWLSSDSKFAEIMNTAFGSFLDLA